MQYMIQGLQSSAIYKDTHKKIAAKIKKHFNAAEVTPLTLGNTLNFVFECHSATLDQAKDFVQANPFSWSGEYEFRCNERGQLVREKFSISEV